VTHRAAAARDRSGAVVRVSTLLTLAAAPLAFGAVHRVVYVVLLAAAFAQGLASWLRGSANEPQQPPLPPGARLLLGLHVLVLFQLVPLPPRLLAVVSPGSFSFYNDNLIVPLEQWKTVSVSPPDTLRGLAFLAGMSCLYFVVFREFSDALWRRRLAGTIVGVGFLITLVALAQSAAGTTRIYGLFQPRWDWAVFGPYVNRNHFAGYLVMGLPLAMAFSAEAVERLARSWRHRRKGWLALGDKEGNAAIRRSAEAMVLMVGLLASQSRGGLMAFGLSAALLLAFRRRRLALLVVTAVAFVGIAWVGLGGVVRGFESRSLGTSRLDLWADALRLVPRFPLLGAGLNGFAIAYPTVRTLWRGEWYGEAHNEYLQALLDLGAPGALAVLCLVALLLRTALNGAPRSALDAGLLGAVLASCAHALVDFNWQIPANAATFAALAGLVMGGASRDLTDAGARA
jgi:O-antigen ligase